MSIRRELNKRRQARRAARATEQGVAGHQAAMAALGRASGGSQMFSNKEEINTHWRTTKSVETDPKDRHVNKGFRNKILNSKLYGDLKTENAAERVGGGPVEPATWNKNSSLASGESVNSVHFTKNSEFHRYPSKGMIEGAEGGRPTKKAKSTDMPPGADKVPTKRKIGEWYRLG